MNSNEHKIWCHQLRCEATLGGPHSSNVHHIEPDTQSSARVQTRIWQPLDPDTWPLIELVAGQNGLRIRADLSLAQARILADGLLAHLTRAQPE